MSSSLSSLLSPSQSILFHIIRRGPKTVNILYNIHNIINIKLELTFKSTILKCLESFTYFLFVLVLYGNLIIFSVPDNFVKDSSETMRTPTTSTSIYNKYIYFLKFT